MKKFLCTCGKVATWEYIPSSTPPRYAFFCEECVPRGCTCNREYTPDSKEGIEEGFGENPPTDGSKWKWIIENVSWTRVDEQNREFPCIEFWESPDGYDVDDTIIKFYEQHNVKYFTT